MISFVNFIKNIWRFLRMRNVFSKRGIIADYLPWLLIGVAVLVILLLTLFVLKGEGVTLIDRLKGLLGGRT